MKYLPSVVNRIKKSDIGNRIASGAFWSLTGTASAKFILLVAGIICARILTQQEYGEYNMIRSTINMFVVFGTAGMGVTATKYIAEYVNSYKEKISSIYLISCIFTFITGILITVLLLVCAPVIATSLNAPHLTFDLRITALLLFILVINSAQNGTLAGCEQFKQLAINNFIGSVVEAVLMLLGAYLYGVTGALLGFAIGSITIFILNVVSVRIQFRKKGIVICYKDYRKEDLKLLYQFSLPAALSSIMVAPAFWVIRTLLLENTGFNELATFEAADQWRTMILFIPTAISQIVLPILTNIKGQTNSYWKVLKYNILINSGVAAVLAIIISIGSPVIMNLYGTNYGLNYPTLIVLALSTIFTASANVVGIAITSRGKMWIAFGFNLCWMLILIIFTSLFLSMGWGATGVSFSILLSYCIHSIIQFAYLKHIK